MTSITNDVLAAKLDIVIVRLDKSDVKLDNMDTKFISQAIYDVNMKEVDLRFKAIETLIKEMNHARWVQNSLSAILGAVLASLILFFFEHIGK